jgi:hypothetical protein
MDTRQRTLPILITGLLILALPTILLADEPRNEAKETKVIIIDNDGEEVVIEMDDVQEIVNEAMEGFEEVMAELDDMQFQVRLGNDNRLNLSYEDTTFELDLDQVMTQVATAVRVGFQEFETDEWAHSFDRDANVSEDELRHELKDLQREMKELRRELRKIKDLDDD